MASKPKTIRQIPRSGRSHGQSAGDAKKAERWGEMQRKMLERKRDPELKK